MTMSDTWLADRITGIIEGAESREEAYLQVKELLEQLERCGWLMREVEPIENAIHFDAEAVYRVVQRRDKGAEA